MTSQISSKNVEKNPDPPLAKFNIPIFSCPMVVPFQKYVLDTWSFHAIKSASALGLKGSLFQMLYLDPIGLYSFVCYPLLITFDKNKFIDIFLVHINPRFYFPLLIHGLQSRPSDMKRNRRQIKYLIFYHQLVCPSK